MDSRVRKETLRFMVIWFSANVPRLWPGEKMVFLTSDAGTVREPQAKRLIYALVVFRIEELKLSDFHKEAGESFSTSG